MNRVAVIIPNWNGEDFIADCLSSLAEQTLPHTVVVVDNGSTDGSVALIKRRFPDVVLLQEPKNRGFAGGVNRGLRYAQQERFTYAALLNSDATADKQWLEQLVQAADGNRRIGAVMSKIVSMDKSHLDGTGEVFTSWGIHYPRGRGMKPDQYTEAGFVFGASGGASLWRMKALADVGLLDEDFFLYYEDIDLNWRLQLRNWKVFYQPAAVVYHLISASSGRVKGLAVYHTMKNIAWVVWKNVPAALLWRILPRFFVAYSSYFASAIQKGLFWYAFRGTLISLLFLPKKLFQRLQIQSRRSASTDYLRSIIEWDLPPEQHRLRRLRRIFTGKA